MSHYSKIKIFVHDTVLDPLHQRGVNRCFINFTQALTERFPGQIQVFSKQETIFGREIRLYPPSKFLLKPIPKRIGRFFDLHLSEMFSDLFSDIYFSPYYGRVKTKIPQLYFAHDMIYEKFPNYYPREVDKKFIIEKKECLERAAMVLCNSQFTEKDILELYPGLDKNKFRINYLGVSDIFREESFAKYIEKPYFLFVGNRIDYKNFLRFLTAFGKSNLSKSFSLRIISPINDFPTDQEKEIIYKFHLENDIHVEVALSDEELHERYAQSFAFIFPSEYEGFGLPLLEAMASGTLTLASNNSSLPEIGGLAPIYFDPFSEDAIVQSLLEATSISTAERQDRINKGIIQSLPFTWQNSKKNFINSIESLLDNKS